MVWLHIPKLAAVALFLGATCAAGAQTTVSAQVQPALEKVGKTVSGLNPEKWKGPKTIREAAVTNLASVRRDLDSTLPGLLTSADAAPGSLVAMLPVSQNLGALYDVLLRISVVAGTAAPSDQAAALDQAVTALEDSRRTLATQLQTDAAGEEQRIADLRKQVAALAVTPQPAAVAVVAAPPPCKSPVKRKKPAPKPPATP